MKGKQFEIGIDHEMMNGAKQALNKCMQLAVAKAIDTGSDEGSATLRIGFQIMTSWDDNTGELKRMPVWDYRAGFSVPIKESVSATIQENSRLIDSADGWQLINGQVSMNEVLEDMKT